jgi:hypothetical protein
MKLGLSPSVPGLFTPRFARDHRPGDVAMSVTRAATLFAGDLGPFEGFAFPGDLITDFVGVGEPRGPQDGVVQPGRLDGVCRRPVRAQERAGLSAVPLSERAGHLVVNAARFA